MASISSKHRRCWMVDVDGVLCNFNLPFLRLLESVSKSPTGLPNTWEPDIWDWYSYPRSKTFFHRQYIDEAWEQVDHMFWLSLPPYEWTRTVLMDLNFLSWGGDVVYYVTSRPNESTALAATQDWLEAYGALRPNVIVVPPGGNKGHIALAIQATHVIDDKPENLVDVSEVMPEAELWLVERPWNRSSLSIGLFKRVKDLNGNIVSVGDQGVVT